jgi:hypothetical protein
MQICASTDGVEAGSDGKGSLGGDGQSYFTAPCEQVDIGLTGGGDDYFVDQSNSVGLCGVDHLARKKQFERRGMANETGKPLRATVAREQPKLDLGLTEVGIFVRDAHMAGKRKLTSSTQGKAIDESDDGLTA